LGYIIQVATVGPRYFETLGIPILEGRDFSVTDRQDTRRVAVINQTMARRFWPGESPIGKRFTPFIGTGTIEVIGLARDSRYITLGEEPTPFFYMPLEQEPRAALSLIVKGVGRPQNLQNEVTAELRRADSQLPIANVATMPDLVDQALWAPRTAAVLLATFAGVALLLAGIGIYGVMAYTVSQRTHEIGLRMAFGASGADMLKLIVGQGMLLSMVGLVLGLSVAVVVAQFISTLLYGVSSADPVTLVVVAIVLGCANLAACYLPARRASRLDPLVALRGD
ncbi:MAG TPA: FtsX-like permease family protein, partial [Vicinamibacterales bacterium]|nr:FtsX-like permease family protein [Vicinamibacterales bacterium]